MAGGRLGVLATREMVGLGQCGGIVTVLTGEHGHGGGGREEEKKVAP